MNPLRSILCVFLCVCVRERRIERVRRKGLCVFVVVLFVFHGEGEIWKRRRELEGEEDRGRYHGVIEVEFGMGSWILVAWNSTCHYRIDWDEPRVRRVFGGLSYSPVVQLF